MTYTHEQLVELERDSIRAFVRQAAAAGHLAGRVLDFGCGKQPYRGLVTGDYEPYDRKEWGGGSGGNIGQLEGRYDAILCTQVLQYVPDPYRLLRMFRDELVDDGTLVLTYPTTWPELRDDLHRFTLLGMTRLLRSSGWGTVETHVQRALLEFKGFVLPLGYGVVARAS